LILERLKSRAGSGVRGHDKPRGAPYGWPTPSTIERLLLLRYNLFYNLGLLLGTEGFLKFCYPLILKGEKGDHAGQLSYEYGEGEAVHRATLQQIWSNLDEARTLSRGLGTPEEPYNLEVTLDTIIMEIDAQIGALENPREPYGAQ
jgi:hypothetical protein